MHPYVKPPYVKPLRQGLTILLAVYWLAMFVATHIPVIPKQLLVPGGDKTHHLVAYAGLAFLLAWRRSFGESALGWKRAVAIFGVAAAYGALDELTQIPVGRTCDVFDWCADLVGASTGLALFAALTKVHPFSGRGTVSEGGPTVCSAPVGSRSDKIRHRSAASGNETQRSSVSE